MPSSAGRTGWPVANTTWPSFRSSPAKRRFWPALVTAPAATRTPPSISVARSCMTTVSAPAGITPPVKMRTASPGPMAPPYGLPANDSPTRFNSVSLGGQVRETHGPAVHRRIVVAGNGDRRHDVLREDSIRAQRGRARAPSPSPASGIGGSARAPVDGHRVRVVVVGARRFAQRPGCGHGDFRSCGKRDFKASAGRACPDAALTVPSRSAGAPLPPTRRPC